MHQDLQIRSVQLLVSNLKRSVEFYAGQLGLAIASRRDAQASLSTSAGAESLLTLSEDSAARRTSPDAAGLFHAALLLPSRAALGRWLHDVTRKGVSLDGFSDHGVSEAIYLQDPDGNGLEFYADRPREAWPFSDGELQMTTEPLDVQDLLASGVNERGSPLTNARWGHLHLRVTDLDRSEAFYSAQLGLSLMQRFGPSARFFSAEGYHHHLGLNRWGGVRNPHPEGSLGLKEAVFARRGADTSTTLADPDGIRLQVIPLKKT
jgi:catechol 2,3-dioxygenase